MGLCASGPEGILTTETAKQSSAKERSFGGKSFSKAPEANAAAAGVTAATGDAESQEPSTDVKLEEVHVRVSFEFKALKDLKDVMTKPKAAKALLTFMKDSQDDDGGLGYNLASYWLEVEDFKGIWGNYE